MTKNEAITRMILAKVSEGMTAVEAAKAVLGADKVDAMIDQLYHQLRGE